MRIIFLFIPIILLVPLNTYGQNSPLEKPSEYNNFIVSEQSKLISKIIEYNISNIHHDNLEENNRKRIAIIQQVDASIERLKATPPYQKDTKLRDEALDVLKLYKEAYDIEFNEINLLRKDRESSFEAMEKYFKAQDQAEEKLYNAGEKFILAQKIFAKEHGTTLKETDTKNQLEELTKVNNYSRKIFLEYFRVSKIDEVFLDALNTQKSDLMDEKRKEIISAAKISLENTSATRTYKNDTIYKIKALELLQYHKNIAEKEYLELVLILQKKDKLTQKDIDRYNEIVSKINLISQKMVEEFNKENREMLKRNIN